MSSGNTEWSDVETFRSVMNLMNTRALTAEECLMLEKRDRNHTVKQIAKYVILNIAGWLSMLSLIVRGFYGG